MRKLECWIDKVGKTEMECQSEILKRKKNSTFILGGLFCNASLLVAREGGLRGILGGGLGTSLAHSLLSNSSSSPSLEGRLSGSGLSGMRDI